MQHGDALCRMYRTVRRNVGPTLLVRNMLMSQPPPLSISCTIRLPLAAGVDVFTFVGTSALAMAFMFTLKGTGVCPSATCRQVRRAGGGGSRRNPRPCVRVARSPARRNRSAPCRRSSGSPPALQRRLLHGKGRLERRGHQGALGIPGKCRPMPRRCCRRGAGRLMPSSPPLP